MVGLKQHLDWRFHFLNPQIHGGFCSKNCRIFQDGLRTWSRDNIQLCREYVAFGLSSVDNAARKRLERGAEISRYLEILLMMKSIKCMEIPTGGEDLREKKLNLCVIDVPTQFMSLKLELN